MVTTSRPAQDAASAPARDSLMGFFPCLSLHFPSPPAGGRKPKSEPLDTELGMTLMMQCLWSTSRSIGQMSALCDTRMISRKAQAEGRGKG